MTQEELAKTRVTQGHIGYLERGLKKNPSLPTLKKAGARPRRLDSWRGIGAIERGMAHQGFDLQLTRYDERGWRSTFYATGKEHSPTSATGTAWERTPWHATRRAAWEALDQREPLTVPVC